MQLRTGGGHVGVALVGADHDVTRGRDTEVTTRHTGVGRQEFVPQTQTGTVGQVGGVVVAFLRGDTFLLEQLTHIVVVQVDGGHHDMTRLLTLQLDDTLTQVGLHHLDATGLQIRVHLTFLGQHRLRFHHLLDIVLLQNAIDDLVKLVGILGPVHDTAVLLGIRGKLVEVFVEVRDGMTFDGTGLLT